MCVCVCVCVCIGGVTVAFSHSASFVSAALHFPFVI